MRALNAVQGWTRRLVHAAYRNAHGFAWCKRESVPAQTGPGRRGEAAYVSDATIFIEAFLRAHPEVVSDQKIGRAIYWDRPVDLQRQEEAFADSVPTDSYYYFGNPW